MIVARAVTLVTAADGSATGYTDAANGRLVAFRYIKTDFADGVDFTITSESSLQTLWTELNVNAAGIRYPLTAAHSTAGVAVTYDGTRPILLSPLLFNERIKVAIASGGDTKTGQIIAYVDAMPG